ncbi:MAG: hypothetical protein H5T65_13205 [Chloroflexi bacterium]|nr:hypothetical protein [Chloroflexota bacterium]
MSAEQLPQGTAQYIQSLENRILRLEENLAASQAALQTVASQVNEIRALIPNSGIVSPSFLRRAFTIWGHYFVAQLLIAIPIYCIAVALLLSGGDF